jgi:tRNA A-37 threonylcarbamoyl transferase component Bud32
MGWDGEGVLAGRYRNLGRIGQGGMGSVWRAYDTDLDREVAIKELRVPEQVTEQERRVWYARMEREARAAARLRHPGIVTVYDRVMGADGRPWIVMELIHGHSLEHLLAEQGALLERQVAAIGLAMLDGLSAAHAHGVVHRDVKPANVLLEGDRVVLTDFGIAAVEGDATLTRSGMVLGTPAYMSPEQVSGKTVTPASDLWSLGATLYAAVEGRPPFTAPTHGALFIAVATQEPAPPRCGGPLARVLKGLLRKDPADRLSPAQVRDLLNTVAGPVEQPDREARPSGRMPATRTSTLRFAGNGRGSGRDYPVAVRGALVCTWIPVAATPFLSWFVDRGGLTGVALLQKAPVWLVGILGLAIIFSCALWAITHRPMLTLATVTLINLGLALGTLLPYAGRSWGHEDPVFTGFGFDLGWLAGTAAFMFAFAGTNQLLAARMPPTSLRQALLGIAVVAEGFMAVMWPWAVCLLANMELHTGANATRFLVALLGLEALGWTAAQAVIWSDRGKAKLGR